MHICVELPLTPTEDWKKIAESIFFLSGQLAFCDDGMLECFARLCCVTAPSVFQTSSVSAKHIRLVIFENSSK